MTRFNFTFQEASPLITYSGLWTEGNPKNDTFADLYDGSFRVASTNTAKAKINFSGTGVTIFGALRRNHGNYTAGLEYGESSTYNGSGFAFKQPLWQAYNLENGSHTVEVANEPTASGISFDLDYVTIEREIGQASNPIFNSTLPSTSPYVKYSGAWQDYPREGAMINQTTELNSQLSITFQGACIELYGLYTNAEYAVSLDNHTVQPMSGMGIDLDPNMWHDDTLLYLMDALPEDVNHTVTVTTTQTSLQRPFFFNYAVVRGTQDIENRFSRPTLTSPSIPTNSQAGNSTSSSQSTPLALILGLSLGGAVLLILVITAFILFRRRRRATFREDHMAKVEPFKYKTAQAPHPWIKLGHARPATEPSTFQLSTVVAGWRRLSGDGQTSSGSLQSPIEHRFRRRDSVSISVRRRSIITPSAHHGKGQQPRITNLPSARFSQQTFGVSEVLTQEDDAGPVIDRAPRVPPAYNPEWGGSQ